MTRYTLPALFLSVSILAACNRDSKGSDGAASSNGAKSAASKETADESSAKDKKKPTAAAEGSASAAEAKPASDAAVDCDLRWGFHGKVAGQDVFLRLIRDGERVVGRYFYAKVGTDIALAGTLAKDGTLSLDEGDAKAPSGHWSGKCDGKTNALEGRWTSAKKDEPFSLERVSKRDKPLVATKTYRVKKKAKSGGTANMKECVYEQNVFELFGAGSPEAEALLNRQDAKTLKSRILDPDMHKQVMECEEGVDANWGEGVVSTFDGFVTIGGGGSFVQASAAHPGNGIGYFRTTYDLATGKALGAKEVFGKLPQELLDKCVAAYEKKQDLGDMKLVIDGTRFDLTPKGVHFYGADYPHVIAALTGSGPIVTWGALLREKALRSDSPAKRLWHSVKAATDTKGDCVLDDDKK